MEFTCTHRSFFKLLTASPWLKGVQADCSLDKIHHYLSELQSLDAI